MTKKEKVKVFEDELKLIINTEVRSFVMACLEVVPDYVFDDCPSSSSGKYHPVDEMAGDGTIVHSKRVSAVAYDLCRALGCEENRDEIVASAILHDAVKQGLTKSGHTIKTHPELAANELVAKVYTEKFKDKISRNSVVIIYQCIKYHYGLWTSKNIVKPLSEYSPPELCLYLSDYIASKRFVNVDYKMR